MARFLYAVAKSFPKLKDTLRRAHMRDSPEDFIRKSFTLSAYATVAMLILLFFLFDKMKIPLVYIVPIVMVSFLLILTFLMQAPNVAIRKREREINQEVLFAGRYILVKLDSGVPLYNSLLDASRSYGVSSKYFKEIVDDIRMGSPIEEALETAREGSPSKYFKQILTEIITSLKTGVDVSVSLREVLQQINKEQVMEIKTYSKKLNAFMMMYMVLATVMPSLGVTMFIVIAGFMGLDLSNTVIFIILFVLAFVQFMFVSILRSMRPMVNL